MSRQELAKITALTFYKDSVTAFRRTEPLPQLKCTGQPCRRFTPDVVRCVNLGGVGAEVDWKCEADLPESLRFGRVEVSCEGWSRPGDPYVLKDSCSLEYRLVQLDKSFFAESPIFPAKSWLKSSSVSDIISYILWASLLAFLLYTALKSCFTRRDSATTAGRPHRGTRPRDDPNRGSGSSWFPGGFDSTTRPRPPPPPYSSKNVPEEGRGWMPGFWTGAALGSLGTYFASGRRTEPEPPRAYDWERARGTSSSFFSRRPAPSPPPHSNSDDRGEGSSNLGPMRRSTGYGGSNVR